MVIDFSKISINEKPIMLLKNLDETVQHVIGHAFNITGDLYYNEISVLEFCVPAYADGITVPYYHDITGMKIIDLVGCGQFILINPKEENDGIKKVKRCKAYSLEYEFAKKRIIIEKGTYCFWNTLSPENTILGRILECMPDWKIGHIDTSLVGKYRTFDDLAENIYDFIKTQIQESYGCVFDFDTYNRKINIVSTTSTIPIKQVYLSNEQLIKKIDINESSDKIITCLDVNGADGVTIRSVNPTGTNKIYNLDYFMNTTYFPQELIDKWKQWEQEVVAYQEVYYNTTVEHNLQLAIKATEEAALTTLNGELMSLENQRAVTVQAIAQSLDNSSSLSSINSKIQNKRNQIVVQRNRILSLQSNIDELRATLVEINNKLRLEKYFTTDEFSLLNKYVFEETFQDSSFVVAKQETYESNDLSNTLDQASVLISGGVVNKTSDSGTGKNIYTLTDGILSIGSLSASVIKATMIESDDNSFVFTAYLNRGTISDSSFVSGCVSAIGTAQNLISSSSKIEFIANSCTMYFTKNTTEYEQHSVEWDLFEYGCELLAQKSVPSYHFEVECGNFLALHDFDIFKNEFEFGNKIYLKIDDNTPIQPYVTAIHINYEDATDFSIEFSSDYYIHNKTFSLSQLIEQSVSMGRTLSSKSGVYSEFVNSGASNRVKEFMESALDVAKNTVLSSGEQAYEIGDAGIRLRKWADEEHTEYSDEQIWLVNNMIAFTTDNWNTANMAIGKIFDENLKSESNPTGMAYGIVSQYLVGTIVAGNNLIISTDNGAFRVDSNGVYIDALKFYITHDGQDYDTTLEDELGKISEETVKKIEETEKTLSQIIGSDGFIDAGKISGLIDTTKSQMVSSSGNVLFDADGLWLMNKSTKSETTQAIWMNENGILFGTGTPSNDPANSSEWLWTTAINHDGIVAEALAGKKLSGCEIYGGYININDNFIVDRHGNLTANSGTFRGVVKGASFQDANGNPMMNSSYQFTSDYLNLHGLKIINGAGETTLEIDSGGNIAMRGNIYMGAGSSINWSDVTETGDAPYATSQDITNALGAYVTKSEVNASIDTYLNSSTGQGAIEMAVSGTYQKKSDMNNYVTTTNLNSSIAQYIDTSTGKAKIVSACSGTYITSSDLSGYAKTSAVTAVEQSVSNVEASISLTASYGSNTIGSNVRALLTLVTNADSSNIKLKADAVEIDGTLYLKASDYLATGTTMIKGSKIQTSELRFQQLMTTSGDYVIDYYGGNISIGGGTSSRGSFADCNYVDIMFSKGCRFGYGTIIGGIYYENAGIRFRADSSTDSVYIGSSTYPIDSIYCDVLYVGGKSITGSDSSSTTTLKETDIKRIYANLSTTKYIELNSSNVFVPSSSGFGLGTTTYPFQTLYIGTGSAYHWKFEASAILPSSTSTLYFNIGSSTYPVNNLYARKIYLNGTELTSGSSSSSSSNPTKLYSSTSSTTYYVAATSGYALVPSHCTSYSHWDLGSSSYYWYNCYLGYGSTRIGYSTSSTLGFFGTTPVVKQSVSSSATVSTLIAALQKYGLV